MANEANNAENTTPPYTSASKDTPSVPGSETTFSTAPGAPVGSNPLPGISSSTPASAAAAPATTTTPSSTSSTTSSSTPAGDSQKHASTTIGELRKQYGAHFAAGYGDNDTLGELLGRSGVNSLEDFLKQSGHK